MFVIRSIAFWFDFRESLVEFFRRAIAFSFVTPLFWEYPCLRGAKIKDNLHLLWWITDPDASLISHIHDIIKFYLLLHRLRGITLLNELLILPLLARRVECCFQLSLKLVLLIWFRCKQLLKPLGAILSFININWDDGLLAWLSSDLLKVLDALNRHAFICRHQNQSSKRHKYCCLSYHMY